MDSWEACPLEAGAVVSQLKNRGNLASPFLSQTASKCTLSSADQVTACSHDQFLQKSSRKQRGIVKFLFSARDLVIVPGAPNLQNCQNPAFHKWHSPEPHQNKALGVHKQQCSQCRMKMGLQTAEAGKEWRASQNLSIQSGLISSEPGVVALLHLAFTLWQHSKFNSRYCMKAESAPNRKMTEERCSATLHMMTGLAQLIPQISGSSACLFLAEDRDIKK